MEDMLVSEYDGCGRCLVGVRRLSRKTDKTSSPQRQGDQIFAAAADAGGHIIAWADDWEVSGATDPLSRRGFGPWLRAELGPYDGVVAASVDRVGRNVRDTLNTQTLLTGQDRVIVTADHAGVWDFSDPNQENEWLMKAWGSQMELRVIQKRNRDETIRARKAGEPKQRPSYGYMYVRLTPRGKIDHVALDPVATENIREVAERILADETGKVTYVTEALRLTRAGIPSPFDRLAQLYGRPVKGRPWNAKTLKHILCSEAALGYLMHDGRPVTGEDGRPVRIAEPLWDRPTHDALVAKTAPKRPGAPRAPKGTRLLSGVGFCGNCGARLYVNQCYECVGRVRGIPASADCKPAPQMSFRKLDGLVGDWFVARYGAGEVMRKVYDPGSGQAAQIAELEATRKRLRDDRKAGLYKDREEVEWYRAEYSQLGEEIAVLKALPERKPGMRMVPTGQTIAGEWDAADVVRRREMLAEFDVRVVVHPTGHDPRVAITGMALAEDLALTA
ncbi:MAG TPA: recombinase family protein [Streptosporangiaceae bacterium]|jgi:DNA invertase Pin-like site-specific DNA recombinase|nr:recombinase family protein [Streptosporangiaceae bacterium]